MGFYERLRRVVHPASAEEREQIISEISKAASPGFDFFLMVVLSCSIATLGLITDSPAVIIGAMLVAPLMSPIVGIGLASITGEARLAEASVSALLRGAFLAILLAIIMTFVNRYLPLVVLQELPAEVVSRTHPSPIDLVIAMAGGLAAAYAMTRKNLSATLPGVAIATALMPPLCTIGIGRMGCGRRCKPVVYNQYHHNCVCSRAGLFSTGIFTSCDPPRLAIAAPLDYFCNAHTCSADSINLL